MCTTRSLSCVSSQHIIWYTWSFCQTHETHTKIFDSITNERANHPKNAGRANNILPKCQSFEIFTPTLLASKSDRSFRKYHSHVIRRYANNKFSSTTLNPLTLHSIRSHLRDNMPAVILVMPHSMLHEAKAISNELTERVKEFLDADATFLSTNSRDQENCITFQKYRLEDEMKENFRFRRVYI